MSFLSGRITPSCLLNDKHLGSDRMAYPRPSAATPIQSAESQAWRTPPVANDSRSVLPRRRARGTRFRGPGRSGISHLIGMAEGSTRSRITRGEDQASPLGGRAHLRLDGRCRRLGPRTSRQRSAAPSPGSTSPTFACSPSALHGIEMTCVFSRQALNQAAKLYNKVGPPQETSRQSSANASCSMVLRTRRGAYSK